MRIVCDASPIIALERINHLWLLERLTEEIFIPRGVAQEIKAKTNINLSPRFNIREVKDKIQSKQITSSLHLGEIEAIALAREIKADLIVLDDKKAREFAEKEGLKVTGLLALLIIAKEKGIIERIKNIVDLLRKQGFFVGEDLYLEVLKLSGEE